MRLTKFLAAAAVASTALTGTAYAGGLSIEVIEPDPIEIVPAPQRSSWGIILPIAAAAILIALAMSNSDEGTVDR